MMTENSEQVTRAGFVALIGAPNAGKSTLTNHFVGSKVSIVSPKAQTTRTMVKGIGVYDHTQIIFLDTPLKRLCRQGKRLKFCLLDLSF